MNQLNDFDSDELFTRRPARRASGDERSADAKLTVAYTRVSSLAQDAEDAYGRASQMRDITTWCELNNITIDKWIEDTITGATLNRKGIDEIRELAEQGRLGSLIIPRQDRFARNAVSAELLHQELESYGVKVINVQVQFDSSPLGKFLRRLLDLFAELDREMIRERTGKGRREAVLKNGTQMYGVMTLGYRWLTKGECETQGLPNGSITPVPEQRVIVEEIFALRELGYAYGCIARILNDRGYRTQTGIPFIGQSITRVIKRERFYRGECPSVSAEALGVSEEEYSLIVPAHEPILPPRPEGQALLCKRVSKPRIRNPKIPADPLVEPPTEYKKTCYITSLTTDYANAVLKTHELRQQGLSQQQIADKLNDDGHRTRWGRHFRHASVQKIIVRFDLLVPLAKEALLRPEPLATPEAPSDWSPAIAEAHKLARHGLGRKKTDMTYAKIADRLNSLFGGTPNGGKFHPQTVIRLLREHPAPEDRIRTVGYVRLTVDGTDHYGQVDGIDTWALANSLVIDSWYVDRGPASSENTLPEFKRLEADIRAGLVGRVACLSLELLCRNKSWSQERIRALHPFCEVFLVESAQKRGMRRLSVVPKAA